VKGERIGEILCRMGVLADEDVARILEHQCQTRQKFGQTAVRLGMATHEQVWEAWARQLAEQENIELAEVGSDTAALDAIPLGMARRIGVVPLRLWGQHLVVAAPHDLSETAMGGLADTEKYQVHVCVTDRPSIQERLRELADKADACESALTAS
jgi:hypothetical protein